MRFKFFASWITRFGKAAEFGIQSLRSTIGKIWFVPVLSVLSLLALAWTAANSVGRYAAERDLATHPTKVRPQVQTPKTGLPAGAANTGVSTGEDHISGTTVPQNPLQDSSPPGKAVSYVPGASALPRNVLPNIANLRVGLPLLILILVWLVERLSLEKPTSIEDKPDFKNALTIWGPVLAGIYKSPRQMKRFLNWLRYLALLENPETEEPSATPTNRIQEHLLVALAVIQKIDRDLVTLTGVRMKGDEGIRAAWIEYTKKFNITPADAAKQRDRFLTLASRAVARYS